MQDNLPNLKKIFSRIDEIREALGLPSLSRLEELIGTKNTLNQYFNPPESPKRKIRTLIDKLSKIGVSQEWVLHGKGPMFTKDIQGRDEESIRYEQIGRAVCNLVEMLGPEIKKSLGTIPNEDEMLAGLMSKVNSMDVPGPAPDLTEDEIEELARRQGGHKTGCDED